MFGLGEACHLGADFGAQDRCCAWAHPRNGIQERYRLLLRDEVLINGSTDAVNRLIQRIDLAEVLGHTDAVMGCEVAPHGCRQVVPLGAQPSTGQRGAGGTIPFSSDEGLPQGPCRYPADSRDDRGELDVGIFHDQLSAVDDTGSVLP
jgi:hypothetical protein